MRWEVLAAINEIETDYGRNLNVSSAGALGWMQFMPPTWKAYGVDANRDGLKDPYNPVDAIFAAARYLRAAGAETDIRKAIFAYNHADWYVDSVLMRARLIGGLPSNFVGSLTGLTQGRFPVHAKATYAGQVEKRDTKRKTKVGDNAALVVEANQDRRGIEIFARRGAPVIAVNDGRIVRTGETERLGSYIQIQDTYGNTYTYGRLGSIAKTLPRAQAAQDHEGEDRPRAQAPQTPTPSRPAAASADRPQRRQRPAQPARHAPQPPHQAAAVRKAAAAAVLPAAAPAKQRLFALPSRPNAMAAGGEAQLAGPLLPVRVRADRPQRQGLRHEPLKKGSRIVAGTILGRIGKVSSTQGPARPLRAPPGRPRRPARRPEADPRRLEAARVDRDLPRQGQEPVLRRRHRPAPRSARSCSWARTSLSRHVLANPRIDIYSCGARDIRSGAIDRRVLATLEFLAASGLKPTVTSMKCGHGFFTASGNVSQHSSGNAVDIAMINGIPIIGHQGKGSITDLTIQRLLTLQGTMKPDQIISLMTFEGADNTLAMGDHADHIHVGLEAALRHQLQGRQAGQRGAQAQAVDQADRPPEGDRQPRGQPPAVEVLGQGDASRVARARRRVARRRSAGAADGSVLPFGERIGPLSPRELAPRDTAGVPLPGLRRDVPADGSPAEGGCVPARAVSRHVGGDVALGLDRQRRSDRVLRRRASPPTHRQPSVRRSAELVAQRQKDLLPERSAGATLDLHHARRRRRPEAVDLRRGRRIRISLVTERPPHRLLELLRG